MADRETTTREALQELLDAELAEAGADAKARYDRHRSEPERIKCARFGDDSVEPVWVFASAGAERLGYDDEEREFGCGRLDEQGVLRDWGTWDSLENALLHFPEDE